MARPEVRRSLGGLELSREAISLHLGRKDADDGRRVEDHQSSSSFSES